ncbi:MAG: hypothetical protein SGI86_20305 [Deltaproteobacteria bacterium]|nr:hypothetical protein [Deltaproteobacteria bacterium]
MNFELALTTLAGCGVEFVVVGGVAVAIHGSSLMTDDLDIVYRVEHDNVHRLLEALNRLDAVVFGDPRRLRFKFDHLNNTGHHLNQTMAGRIDALGSIGVKRKLVFEDLIRDTKEVEAFGVSFRILDLDRLIEVKTEMGRPRDKLAVMELEAIRRNLNVVLP